MSVREPGNARPGNARTRNAEVCYFLHKYVRRQLTTAYALLEESIRREKRILVNEAASVHLPRRKVERRIPVQGRTPDTGSGQQLSYVKIKSS
jgi:hypothetical protein